MQFKTDTKEKFHVIRIQEPELSASMAEEMEKLLLGYLQNVGDNPVNLVVDFAEVSKMENEIPEKLVEIQQQFYSQNCSFVICQLNKNLSEQIKSLYLLDTLNITPSESEAWDIIQMEEIERELLNGEE